MGEPRPYLSLSLCPSPKCARVRASIGGSDRRAADARQRSCAGRGGGGGEGREDRGRCGQAGIYSQARRRRAVRVAGSREPPRRGRRRAAVAVAVRRGRFFTGLDWVGSGRVQSPVACASPISGALRLGLGVGGFCFARRGPRQRASCAPTRPVPFPAVARRRRLARSTVFFSVWHQWRSWP